MKRRQWFAGGVGPGILALLILASIPATGQIPSTEPGFLVEEDPDGDVEIEYDRARQPAPEGYEHADLLAVWVGAENETHVEVGLALAAWEADTQQPIVFAEEELSVLLDYRGQTYRISYPLAGSPCSTGRAPLERLAGVDYYGERWNHLACLATEVNVNAATFRADVTKTLIVDQERLPLRYGQQLDGFWAQTRRLVAWEPGYSGFAGRNNTAWAVDRAPNDGMGPPVQMQEGLNGQGNLQLLAIAPSRVATEEAGTIAFDAYLDNLGRGATKVLVSLSQLEAGWQGRVPDSVSVRGGETVHVPVLVSIDASDRRGVSRDVILRAQDASDEASYSEFALTLVWPRIRQPSQASNTLYFHADPDGSPFTPYCQSIDVCTFNTQPPEPGDYDGELGSPRSGTQSSNTGGSSYSSWSFFLLPELAVGLNFDVEGRGNMVASVERGAGEDIPDVQAIAEVYYCDSRNANEDSGFSSFYDFPYGYENTGCPSNEWTLIAYGESPPDELRADQTTRYDFFVYPRNESDYLAFHPNAQLALNFLLTATSEPGEPTPRPVSQSATLTTKGMQLTLPLLAYTDPVEQAIREEVGNLKISPLGATEKLANPGNTTLFHFSVGNDDVEQRRIELVLEGQGAAWARWDGADGFTLPGGENRTATLVVKVPQEAKDGATAEVFVVARLRDSPEVAASARIFVIVTSDIEVPDEAGQLTNEGSGLTPAPGAPWAAAALSAAMLLAWRRRRV